MNILTSRSASNAHQRGASLLIALIALISMTLAGIALVRSVDTSNLIAGNFAFRQSAMHVTDGGVEAAVSALGTIVSTSLDNNWPAGCAAGACNYYSTRQPINSNGVPTIINWGVGGVPPITPVIAPDYAVQYVIDRLCDGAAPVTDIAGNCYADTPVANGSKNAGAITFSGSQTLYYRVTVRVSGPRNTVSMVQVVLNR